WTRARRIRRRCRWMNCCGGESLPAGDAIHAVVGLEAEAAHRGRVDATARGAERHAQELIAALALIVDELGAKCHGSLTIRRVISIRQLRQCSSPISGEQQTGRWSDPVDPSAMT